MCGRSIVPLAGVISSRVPRRWRWRSRGWCRPSGSIASCARWLRGVIVGDGPERGSLERLAGELGLLPGGVAFFGARGDVPRLMSRADMLVLTSQHEGFPNVLLEGLTARLPVVATPAGDAAELVRDGQTGFLVPFDDHEILVRRLIELARSPATRRVLGSAGRALVEQRYGLGGLATRALRIYHDAARQQHSARTLRAVDALAR
jgi:glycosyltransferase involved in cell wall biosynthesis